MNSRYIPQLLEVLTWPQSAGIVGGRPGSSLYFIGCQDQSILFLDPHEVQQVSQHLAFQVRVAQHCKSSTLSHDGAAVSSGVCGQQD